VNTGTSDLVHVYTLIVAIVPAYGRWNVPESGWLTWPVFACATVDLE